jgi:hypothetical protein
MILFLAGSAGIDTVNPISFNVIAVVAQLEIHNKKDEYRAGNAQGQTSDVNQRIRPVSKKASDARFKEVEDHFIQFESKPLNFETRAKTL